MRVLSLFSHTKQEKEGLAVCFYLVSDFVLHLRICAVVVGDVAMWRCVLCFVAG